MCVGGYVCMYVLYTYTHTCVRTYVHTLMDTHGHTHTHTHTHSVTHTQTHTCTHARTRTHTHTHTHTVYSRTYSCSCVYSPLDDTGPTGSALCVFDYNLVESALNSLDLMNLDSGTEITSNEPVNVSVWPRIGE